MKVCVFNHKGGQGKSLIAIQIAIELNCAVITNDVFSPLEEALPQEGQIVKVSPDEDFPALPEGFDFVYDLGGHPDQRVLDVIKESDVVIVPMIYVSFADLAVGLNTLNEIKDLNSKILVVANKVHNDTELEDLTTEVRKHFDYPILPLSPSKSLIKVYESGLSPRQLRDSKLLSRRLKHYQKTIDQLSVIFTKIKDF